VRLSLGPAGLAVGLALKELRYGHISPIRPWGGFPCGSPAPRACGSGIRQVWSPDSIGLVGDGRLLWLSEEGVDFYWVRITNFVGPRASGSNLRLVAIDEVGNVTPTTARGKDDPAAPTQEEAVLEHLAGAIAATDAKLDRRRAALPDKPEPEPTPPTPDRATEKFMEDDRRGILMALTVCLQPGCGALLTVDPCWCREDLSACEDMVGCDHVAHFCEAAVHFCDQHALDDLPPEDELTNESGTQ